MLVQIARLKFGCLEEGTGIDFSFGADAAGSSRCAADIQSRQFVAKGVEMEERIGGQHVWVKLEPIGKLAVLLTGRMQIVPYILPAPGRTQARNAQFRIKTCGD